MIQYKKTILAELFDVDHNTLKVLMTMLIPVQYNWFIDSGLGDSIQLKMFPEIFQTIRVEFKIYFL